ncbi:hypothetical protein TNCV_3918911 [Trichonephila clavipes]|nr:hypothetical protein TNCV_3918911 [Trichonephila clavipes]
MEMPAEWNAGVSMATPRPRWFRPYANRGGSSGECDVEDDGREWLPNRSSSIPPPSLLRHCSAKRERFLLCVKEERQKKVSFPYPPF